MQTPAERPYLGCNFLVDLGDRGDALAPAAGFAEVIFPPFQIKPARRAGTARQPRPATSEGANRLVLRRGASGARDLYLWWNQARLGKAPKQRTVTVRLLAQDHESVLTTWRFTKVLPVSLSYTPLNAMAANAVMETIELEFDDVEML